MKKMIFSALTIGVLAAGSAASASEVLLDTITGTFNPNGGNVVGVCPGGPCGYSSPALGFSTGSSAETITSIEAFIAAPAYTNSITLGIMSSVGGAPSGTFLDVTTVSVAQGTTSPLTLSNLNWSLAANTQYWLVGEVASGFLVWNAGAASGLIATTNVPGDASGWTASSATGLLEARITGVAVTPLPSSLSMFVGGLAAFGLFGWLRARGRRSGHQFGFAG